MVGLRDAEQVFGGRRAHRNPEVERHTKGSRVPGAALGKGLGVDAVYVLHIYERMDRMQDGESWKVSSWSGLLKDEGSGVQGNLGTIRRALGPFYLRMGRGSK